MIDLNGIKPGSLGEIRDNPDPLTEPRLYQNEHITAIPTAAPMISSLEAQLRKDLWQQDSSGIGYFQHQAKGSPTNIIEHYLTSAAGNISLLPWDDALQIIDKFGLTTAKLHLIFAAHTMRQEKPWESQFTLKASDLIAELGWDKRTDLTKFQKLNEIANAAFALQCLLVKAVWVEGYGKKRAECSVQTSRIWDAIVDVRGEQLNPEGNIEKPTEVYITVRPGLWTYAFLNKAGCQAKEALYQFGYLAQDILKINPYHDELALRLGLHMTMQSRFHTSGTYKIQTVLKALLPQTLINAARSDRDKARKLTNRWNHALIVLMGLERAFQIEFDPETYPEELRPLSIARKPRKYFDKLLAAKIIIHPPAPIPTLLSAKTEPKPIQPKLQPASPGGLASNQIRNGRLAKSWSQAKLAGWLGVTQAFISQIEKGDRTLSAEMETKLKKLLDIQD